MDSILSRKVLGAPAGFWLVIGLLAFHALNNILIVSRDNTPLMWDGGDYFVKSLKYYDVFANPGPGFLSRFNEVSPYRPPLFLLTPLPLYVLFGRSPDVAVTTNLLYLTMMLLAVYGIGRRMHGEWTGVLASMITSTFPILFGLSRSYWADFPLTAMVALGIYLLLRTEGFTSRKYSVLFGVSAGLGMLTKWTYFVFVGGPLLYFLAGSVMQPRSGGKKYREEWVNVAMSAVVGAVVASFWYVPNGLDVARKLFGLAVGMRGEEATRFQQLGETIGPPGILSAGSLTYFAGQFVNYQTSFLSAVLVAAGAVILLARDRRNGLWLLVWIVVPLVTFTLIKNKTVRNTVPILPGVGLVIAAGIMQIRRRLLRRGLVLLAVVGSILQYAASSYGTSRLPARLAVRTPIGLVVLFQQHANTSFCVYKASVGDWRAEEILQAIESSRGSIDKVRIVLLPRDAFTWMALEYTSYLKRLPFTFIGAVDSPEAVLESDYVLVKKGGIVAPWFLIGNVHRSLDLMEARIADFSLVKSVVLPEERSFLPVFDNAETRRSRKAGVVFGGKLQVLETSVSGELESGGNGFSVEAKLRSIEAIDAELMVTFTFQNRQAEVVAAEMVRPDPPIFGWKPGETHTVRATVSPPASVAATVFGVEMGFGDRASRLGWKYRPEYLVYKRTVRGGE